VSVPGLALAERLTTLPLSEVFGPTIQGEGPHAGRRVGFVRLGLCNLSCVWCDTAYTWDTSRYDVKAECPDTPIAAIREQAAALNVETVVLSGGEPLIFGDRLRGLVAETLWNWHAETNGTLAPPRWWSEWVAHTSVSPKLAHSGDPLRKRIKPRALHAWSGLAWAGQAAFKFVATDPADLDDIDALVTEHDLPRHKVWVMPEGRTSADVLATHRRLMPAIEEHGYHTSTRLHVLLWDDERRR
jgi:organic radical activating enzyme